jgi:hypothetical protein
MAKTVKRAKLSFFSTARAQLARHRRNLRLYSLPTAQLARHRRNLRPALARFAVFCSVSSFLRLFLPFFLQMLPSSIL